MSSNFFKKSSFRYALAGFAVAVIGYGGWIIGVPVAHEFNDSFAMKEFRQYGVAGTYRMHFFSFLDRFQNLANLETENETLRAQIAKLEKDQVVSEAKKTEQDLATMNTILEEKLKTQAGSEEAHLPQTITYQVPAHMTNAQLYALALAYFRKQDFEKAAVIFANLFTANDDQRYQSADNYLLSGIAWYRLKDYTLARKDIAEATSRSQPRDEVHRQAMLWSAIIEKTEGKNQVAQGKLLKFIGDYPHSLEAQWVNGNRKPARADIGSREIGERNFAAKDEKAVQPATDDANPKQSEAQDASGTAEKDIPHESP